MTAFTIWLFLIENPPLLCLAVVLTSIIMAARP